MLLSMIQLVLLLLIKLYRCHGVRHERIESDMFLELKEVMMNGLETDRS